MRKQHFLASLVSACALLFGTSSPAQTTGSGVPGTLVPVADFFRTAKLIDPELSPDGRFVAVGAGADNGRVQLVVLDLANPAASKVAVSLADADVIQIAWVNSERLVFSVRDLQQSDRNMAPGLWAVNRDGKEFKELIKAHGHILSNDSQARIDRRLSWEWELHSTLRDGTADVIVEAPTFDNTWDVTGVKIGRLDTQTGRLKYLDAGAPAHSMGWVLDRDGQPAMVTTQSKGRVASYVRNGGEWTLWEEADSFARTISNPFWVGPNQQLLVTAPTPSGTAALYEVEPRTLKRADQPLVKLSGYDFGGQLIYDDQAKRLLGVHFETDAPGTAWFDSSMQELQKEIDKLLPATVNQISCKRCISVPVALVSALSDRSPPAYYIYRSDTKALEPLGASRPWIKPAQMGLRDLYRFEARDKRMIPALVTQPAGKSNIKRPAVVLVHGGPFVRGNHWAWESEAQFLASRGYVVIEPDFRGSTGYGFDHFQAGWKQWGLAMQDDVADSVKWAVKQGWVDPGRVCIAGASYGGYAVLMGLIKDPDLYQCGINWVGVTDINLMYDITWSDFSEEWKRYGMPTLVGDQVKDAQQLKNTSPLEQAPRLKRPLLMAYGGLDQRVPIRHGTAFRDAVMKNNKDVEWVVYPREGHGWFELETNVDFWTRVEKFLARNIGPQSLGRGSP